MNDDESDFLTNDDLAITNLSEDILGRTEKAHKLALNIQNYLNSANSSLKKRKENSFVIAVLGKWGEGKTSFINLIVEKLTLENNETKNNLTRACCNCFKIIGFILKLSGCSSDANIEILQWDPWYFPAKTDIGKQLHRLIEARCRITSLINALPTIGVASLLTLILSYLVWTHLEKVGSIILLFLIITIILYILSPQKQKQMWNQVLDKISWVFSYDPINSLLNKYKFNYLGTKSELGEITKNRKLLIVIDDIDRMKPTQIKQIFDLVKGVGNLPNVVYLIAFDKIVVSKAINPDNPTEREKYLDKLINCQVPLYYNYRELLIKRITEELKTSEREIYIPPELGNVITNLREIKQLTSSTKEALSFIKNSIKDDSFYIVGNQKIDLQDINLSQLLCIRAILLHNKAIYDLISENKEILTASDFKNEEVQQKLANFKESINNLSQSYALKQLVDSLFPIERDLNYKKDIQSIPELWCIAISELRKSPRSIWHPNYFEVFFALSYPKYLVNSNQYSLLLQEDNQNKQENIYQIISDIIKKCFSKQTFEKQNLDSKMDNDYRDNKYKWLTDLLEKLIQDFKDVRSYHGVSLFLKRRENILNYIIVIAQAVEEDVLEYNSIYYSYKGDNNFWPQFRKVFFEISTEIFTEDLKRNVELFQRIKEPQPVCAFLIYLNLMDTATLGYALKEKPNDILTIITELTISNLLSVNFLLDPLFYDYFCQIIKFCTCFSINKKENTNFIPLDNFELLISKIKRAIKENNDLFLFFVKFSHHYNTVIILR